MITGAVTFNRQKILAPFFDNDTLHGFGEIAERTSFRNIIVWINEYFGPVEWNGTRFPNMAVYKRNERKILGAIALPRRREDTVAIEEMVTRNQTFAEASESNASKIMTKQRLNSIQRYLFDQLDEVPFFMEKARESA